MTNTVQLEWSRKQQPAVQEKSMPFQSHDEVLRIFDEFGRKFAPEGLILNERNARLLADYLFRSAGVVSISGLIEAAQTLAAQLDWVPKPKELSEQEKAIAAAEKMDARMRKDYFDSLKQRDTQKLVTQKADEAMKAATAKEVARINGEIDREINNYVCGHHSGHTDFGRTESGQQTLRKVRDSHNRTTVEKAQHALNAVRTAKSKLP